MNEATNKKNLHANTNLWRHFNGAGSDFTVSGDFFEGLSALRTLTCAGAGRYRSGQVRPLYGGVARSGFRRGCIAQRGRGVLLCNQSVWHGADGSGQRLCLRACCGPGLPAAGEEKQHGCRLYRGGGLPFGEHRGFSPRVCHLFLGYRCGVGCHGRLRRQCRRICVRGDGRHQFSD